MFTLITRQSDSSFCCYTAVRGGVYRIRRRQQNESSELKDRDDILLLLEGKMWYSVLYVLVWMESTSLCNSLLLFGLTQLKSKTGFDRLGSQSTLSSGSSNAVAVLIFSRFEQINYYNK